jgi:hypothetical protein
VEPCSNRGTRFVLDGADFDPFRHGIDCHDRVDLTIATYWGKVSDEIDAPLIKRLRGFMGRMEMRRWLKFSRLYQVWW